MEPSAQGGYSILVAVMHYLRVTRIYYYKLAVSSVKKIGTNSF